MGVVHTHANIHMCMYYIYIYIYIYMRCRAPKSLEHMWEILKYIYIYMIYDKHILFLYGVVMRTCQLRTGVIESQASSPPTTLSNVLNIRPWPLGIWYHTPATASRFWAGTTLHGGPCTSNRVNSNYEPIAACPGCQLRKVEYEMSQYAIQNGVTEPERYNT